jgi:hypothetical protein
MSEISLVLANTLGVSSNEVSIIFGVCARYSSFFTLLCLSFGSHDTLQNAVIKAIKIINMNFHQRLVIGSKFAHYLEGIRVELGMRGFV